MVEERSAARVAVRLFVATANVLLVAMWLLGFAAAFVRPSSFWLAELLAVGLPVLTLALVPFAILHAVRRKWPPLIVHVMIVALSVNRHWSFDRLARPPIMRDDKTLMTFNTPRFPDTEEAMIGVNALVRATRPDMIAIQESIIFAARRDPLRIRAHAKFRAVVDSMNYASLPPTDGPEGASWTRWVQPFLSLDPIEKQEQFVFDRDIPGWPSLHILRTEMKLEGRSFAHYNVHLFTYGASKPWGDEGGRLQVGRWRRFLSEVRTSFRVREWQADRIRELVDRESMPVVISGDFNSTADNWVYHRLSAGFADAFRVAGQGWGGTYHAEYPLLRIDFVLLGPEFEAVRASVPKGYDTKSDHLPLVVRLRWRQAA